MLNKSGTMIGEVCHIEAVSRKGPRFRKGMTDEALRSADNLILLCRNHHTTVDSDTKKYTVAKLKAMKAAHEKKFAEVGDTLRRSMEFEFKDETQAVTATAPKTLKRYKKFGDPDLTVGDLQTCLKEIASFTKKLQLAPIKVRKFIVAIIKRQVLLDKRTHHITVPVLDVKGALSISHTKINELGAQLSTYELGDVDQYLDDGGYAVHVRDIGNHMPLITLAKYCEATSTPLADILVDLKFNLLD